MLGLNGDLDFHRVEAGSLVRHRCSPSIDERDFRGIRLSGPGEVFLPGPSASRRDRVRMVVCGAYQLESSYLGVGERFLSWMLFVAVDALTHEPRAGTTASLLGDEPEVALRAPAPPGRVVGGYFNPDVARLLALPAVEAEYLVHASLGDFVSNVLRIRVCAGPSR